MTDVAHNGAEAPAPDVSGGTVLVFLNEVAGGRKLLSQVRERIEAGAERIAIAAPQNQPVAGQIVDRSELADAAKSRVEVTQSVFAEFGIEAEGAIMDPDPLLALDDAIRAFEPAEVLLSCLDGVPLRPDAPQPRRLGAGRIRDSDHARPGPPRRRRDPLGRHAHARGGDADGRLGRPPRPPQVARG